MLCGSVAPGFVWVWRSAYGRGKLGVRVECQPHCSNLQPSARGGVPNLLPALMGFTLISRP